MLLLKTVDSRTAKKTCSKNMAQCRELEKMGSVSRTNCIDRVFRGRKFNRYCKPSKPFIVLMKQLFHTITAKVLCNSTAICSGIQFIRKPSESNQKNMKKSSDSRQTAIRQPSGSQQNVIK